jgi:hypothetical protein
VLNFIPTAWLIFRAVASHSVPAMGVMLCSAAIVSAVFASTIAIDKATAAHFNAVKNMFKLHRMQQ